MKSFDERYVRSMRTCALVISFLTVMLLNANFFDIYRQVSNSNNPLQTQLVNAGQQISQKVTDQQAAAGQSDLTQTAKTVQDNVALYTSFGFEGPSWIKRVWKKPSGIVTHDALETIVGWLITTLLLSVGAPFWQDALESLFGLKNFLNNKQQAPKQPES